MSDVYMPRTTVWIRRILYNIAKENNIKFAPILNTGLEEEIKRRGIDLSELEKEDEDVLVIRTECNKCGHQQNTRSIKNVVCFRCNKTYKVYPKGQKCRVIGIVQGDEGQLQRLYYKTFNK